MINFLLPGFYEHFHLFKEIILLKENNPDIFYPEANIGACYGNFQVCAWDGGRTFRTLRQASKEDVEEIYNFYKAKNIPLRLIFTNPEIQEHDLNNHFCNLVAEICHDENNEIVVNSPLLENYIKTTYPKYKIISSTTKCLTSLEDSSNELNKDYYMVCLDYNLNYNMQFLNNIPKENRDKVEFLINAICPAGCPNRKEHYRLNGLYYLNYGKHYNISCGIKDNTLDYDSAKMRNNISPTDIYNTYAPLGFSNFKLEGRSLPDLEVLINIVKYMIKPEYQLQTIFNIYHKLYPEN
jgi:hypothetical protein